MNAPDFWLARFGAPHIVHLDPAGGWTHLWIDNGSLHTGWTADPPTDLVTRFVGLTLPTRKAP
jgi:hypothetical protein